MNQLGPGADGTSGSFGIDRDPADNIRAIGLRQRPPYTCEPEGKAVR